MGLILVPRLGTAVMIRKIDRLSSRRACFETRRQEANVWFKRLLKRFFVTLSPKG